MLTPKQKAKLKGLANPISNRYQIGKGEIDQSMITMLDNALESHELIKVAILQNSSLDAKEASLELARLTRSDVVQVIGRVIVLYRPAKEPKIVI